MNAASLEEALALIDATAEIATSFNTEHVSEDFWDRFSRALQPVQAAWWERAYGPRHSPGSWAYENRQRRNGYYENPKVSDADASGPRYVWTGLMRKSTTLVTERGRLRGRIDTGANYAGPLPYRDPVEALLVPQSPPWNTTPGGRDSADTAAERALEDWLTQEVVPRAERLA